MKNRMKKLLFALLILFAASLHATDGKAAWQRVRSVDHVIVETSPLPDSKLARIRGVATIDAPLAKVLAVFDDPDKLVKWVHRLVTAKKLRGDKKDFSLYLRFDMPMGVADRDVVVDFKRTKDEKARIIYEGRLQKGHAGQKGAVGMVRFHSQWIFESRGGKTHLTYVQHSDPGGLLPAPLVMPVAIDMVLNTLIKMKKIVKTR